MKIAVSLALFVAVALGPWAIYDYRDNEEVRRQVDRDGLICLGQCGSQKAIHINGRLVVAGDEGHDAAVGVVSIAFLVGSIILFRRKSKASQTSAKAA
jgi:hypothetical protein